MSDYRLEKEVISCEVTKELLTNIEEYLIKKISSIFGVTEDGVRKNYTIAISDEYGIESINSISEYNLPKFDDSVTEIILHISIQEKSKLFRINIKFSKLRTLSKITISYNDNNSKEVVIGLYEGIKKIINTKKTINKIFNPSEKANFILLGILIGSISLFYTYIAKNNVLLSLIYLGISMPIIIYMTILKKIFPYILFETNQSNKKKKVIEWFVFGLFTFIIFGTLLVALRRKYFGF